MDEMRRKDRAVSEQEAKLILHNGEYGVLSMSSDNNEPYGVPLSYCVVNDSIYFHCAVKGKKLKYVELNKSVSFCVVGKTEVLPNKFSTKYESVIVNGIIDEAFGESKQIGLEGLVQKYSPEHIEKGIKYISEADAETKVYKLYVNSLTGKSRK